MLKIKKIIYIVLLAALLTGCGSGTDKYTLRDEAIALYNAGDYAGAIEGFQAALDATRGEVSDFQYDVLKYRAECEMRLGDYDAARNTYGILLDTEGEEGSSDYSAVLEELQKIDGIEAANKLFEDGNYSDAYDAYSEYASFDGSASGSAAAFNKAVCAEHIGRYDEAYTIFETYLKLHPDDEAADKEMRFCESRMQ